VLNGGEAGVANTGGGGGGGGNDGLAGGGNGGSGVVIFSIDSLATVSFSGVTETNTIVSGKKVFTITATDPGATVTIA
jgi:hypothetical protein